MACHAMEGVLVWEIGVRPRIGRRLSLVAAGWGHAKATASLAGKLFGTDGQESKTYCGGLNSPRPKDVGHDKPFGVILAAYLGPG